jgi:S-adenosylmethionine hydrolase
MPRPVITLLTDFGTRDHYVAAMKGVILGICPEAQIVDISHEIASYSIAEGAYTLSQAWRHFPAGTIHIGVVDPGVGSKRRPVVIEAGGHLFVGPDNGLFTFALAAAGKWRARHLRNVRYFHRPVSRTFHGRDIFAPVAAHLAAGVDPQELGSLVRTLTKFPSALPQKSGKSRCSGTVISIDKFGNVVTNITLSDVPWIGKSPFELRVAGHIVRDFRPHYSAKTTAPFLVQGSGGWLEISLAKGHASNQLRIHPGDPVEIQKN